MILTLFFWFQVKHLIWDFLIQPPWMYKNKHNIFHPGGYIHAAFHGAWTMVILLLALHGMGLVTPMEIAFIGLAEFTIHYFVDWGKMNLNEIMGWRPNNNENFWRLLGVDQFLHQLTYLGIIWWVLT